MLESSSDERFTSAKPIVSTSIHTSVVTGTLMSKPRYCGCSFRTLPASTQEMPARDLLADATAAARRDGDAATASVAVRPGDVYAMMIEHVYARGDANGACDLLEEMSREGVVVGPYVDDHVVAAATRDAGRTLSFLKGGGVRDSGLVQGVTLGIDGGVVDEEWSPPPPPEDFDDDDDDDA